MDFWEQNKTALTASFTALLALLVLHLAVLRPLSRSAEALAGENDDYDERLEEYYPEGGMSVEILKEMFESSNAALRGVSGRLEGKLGSAMEAPFIVPPGEPQAGFYFRRLLTTKRDELLFYASTHGMDSIEKSLGFGESVPVDEEVPTMLRQLAAACELVTTASDAGIRSIEAIEQIPVETHGAPGYQQFITEYRIRMTMKCDLDGLMKFVDGIEKRTPFLGLVELNIGSDVDSEDNLQVVEAVAASFEISKTVRVKPLQPGRPGGIKTPAPTYGF